jgi:hypothetical protein
VIELRMKPADHATPLLAFLKEYRELQSSVSEPEPTNVPQQFDPDRLVQFCEVFQPIFGKCSAKVNSWISGLWLD